MPTIPYRDLAPAGEIDRGLWGKSGSPEYRGGLRTCLNWIIRKNGKPWTRPGTKFRAPAAADSVRFLEFDFGGGDSYVIEATPGRFRFFRNGRQVREAGKAITALTAADPGVVTITGHGFSDGDAIYLSGIVGMSELNYRWFRVLKVDADTFQLLDSDGNPLDTSAYTTYVSGGTAERVYEVATPYTAEDLPNLNYDQSFDVLKIACRNRKMQDLIRVKHDQWTLTDSLYSPSISAPSGVGISGTGTGAFWVVTAVKKDTFEESLASTPVEKGAPTSGSPRTVSWTAQTDAVLFKIYRRLNGIYGLVGEAQGTSFSDVGASPDTTKTPLGIQGSVSSFGVSMSKLDTADFPLTAGPGNGLCMAWHPSGKFVAVGYASSTYLRIYLYEDGVFTNITSSAMASIPAGAVNSLAFSPDGQYLSAAASVSPYGFVWRITGQTFTLLSSPFSALAGNAFGTAWSKDSRLLSFAHATTPFFKCFSRNGETFTAVSVVGGGGNPTAQGNACTFSNGAHAYEGGSKDSVTYGYLVIGHNNASSRSITIYAIRSHDGAPYVKLNRIDAIPAAVMPGHNVLSVAWPQNVDAADILTVGYDGGDHLWSYKFLGIKTVNTTVNLGLLGSIIFPTNVDQFESLGAVAGPDGAVNGLAVTSNGLYLAAFTSGTEKLMLFAKVGDAWAQDPASFTDLAGNGRGGAFSADLSFLGGAGETTPYAEMYAFQSILPSAVGYTTTGRLRIAATESEPDREWQSAEGAPTNFQLRTPLTDRDSHNFRVSARKYNRILHLISIARQVQLTTSGPIVLHGDANGNVTPYSVNPRSAGANGASRVRPALVGDTAVYVGATGRSVFDLRREIETDFFRVTDLTERSAHIFRDKSIIAMAYQERPDSVVWLVLDDGTAATLTFNREERIVGWARHETDGRFLDVACVRGTDGKDVVYFAVAREVESVERVQVETLGDREETSSVDEFSVDFGASFDGRPDGEAVVTLTGGPAWSNNTLTAFCSKPLFTPEDAEGAQRRLKFTLADGTTYATGAISGFTSPFEVSVAIGATAVPSELRDTPSASWVRQTSTVKGLWHLEGQEVSILADGKVVSDPLDTSFVDSEEAAVPAVEVGTLAGGRADLPGEVGAWDGYATVIHVGLPFKRDLRTLPMDGDGPDSAASQKIHVSGLFARLNASRGIFAGPEPPGDDESAVEGLSRLQDQVYNKHIHYVLGGSEIEPFTGLLGGALDGKHTVDGGVFLRVTAPVFAEVDALYPVAE